MNSTVTLEICKGYGFYRIVSSLNSIIQNAERVRHPNRKASTVVRPWGLVSFREMVKPVLPRLRVLGSLV